MTSDELKIKLILKTELFYLVTPSLVTYHCFYIFDGPTECGALCAFDDGTLDEVWMFDHQGNQLIVRVLALAESEFTIDGFACAQQLAWANLHLPQKRFELFLVERFDVVVDFFKRDAALTEQLVNLSTLRSGRLLVNCYLVCHQLVSHQGKIPRILVASATLSTARMYAPIRMSVPYSPAFSWTERKATRMVVSKFSLT